MSGLITFREINLIFAILLSNLSSKNRSFYNTYYFSEYYLTVYRSWTYKGCISDNQYMTEKVRNITETPIFHNVVHMAWLKETQYSWILSREDPKCVLIMWFAPSAFLKPSSFTKRNHFRYVDTLILVLSWRIFSDFLVWGFAWLL